MIRVIKAKKNYVLSSKDSFEDAYESALRFIEYAPQMEKPLFMKLIKKGFSISTVKDVMEKLKDVKLLDDEAISSKYVDRLINRNLYGYNIIVKKLVEKGITKSEAERLTNDGFERNFDEETVLKKFIKKNSDTFIKLYEGKETGKIAFKLQSKGFTAGTIEKNLNNIFNILNEIE